MSEDQRASHDSDVPPALAADLLTGWAADPVLDTTPQDVAPYAAKRRAALSPFLGPRAAVIPSGILRARAGDTDYAFRASSDYTWLTGDTEPDGVLVLQPVAGGHEAVLYVPARSGRTTIEFFASRAGELWVGRRPDPAETGARLAVECRPFSEAEAVLTGLADPVVVRGVDPRIDAWCSPVDARGDAELLRHLAELRLLKDDWELGQLREATAATARGFADVIRERAGALEHGERWLEGTFWRRARAEGNDVGYSSIVASGAHATTLHWSRNDGRVRDGDLLLMDMGVETRSLYTADVTRTIPFDGRFSPDQRAVYDLVLAAQRAGIDAVRPGAEFLAPNRAAMRVLAEGLHAWGILRVAPDEALDEDPYGSHAGLHRRYTLHNVSHMLGIDVHDCAAARTEAYREGILAGGMVLTVEPGLYFQPDDLTVPEELRGIGVRIEDDILVTRDGHENLSDQLPRSAADVERWVAAQR
ncbi:MAG TPA: aminopeptidase P family protein [Mycobacteriales bacterium]